MALITINYQGTEYETNEVPIAEIILKGMKKNSKPETISNLIAKYRGKKKEGKGKRNNG